MDAAATWALFDEIAAVVRSSVAASDRGAPGTRQGQYGLDLVADQIVVARLLDAGFGVMSEESGRHEPDRPICVVVDPVDGSTNASRGLPSWAVSLCAVDRDGPWLASVVDATRRVTWRAERGRGATRQEGDGGRVPITVASPVDRPDAIVAVNGWPPAPLGIGQFRALGAAAIELCLVADGSLDAYVAFDPDGHGPWDYLAAMLVVREAGGIVADRDGRELVTIDHSARRTLVAASGPALLDAMMAA